MDQQALEILTWYREQGVDIALMDEPVDQFAEAERLAAKEKTTKSTPHSKRALPERATSAAAGKSGDAAHGRKPAPPIQMSGGPTPPDPELARKAASLAQKAGDLEALEKAVSEFEGCNLKRTAKTTVFSHGNSDAGIMLVGDVPATEDDAEGLPFVGPAGQLLDRILAAIGHDRESVYLTNIIPWRPPGSRTPTPHEIEACKPFALRHLELAKPEMVVLLGDIATRTLLGRREGIVNLRGNWQTLCVNGKDIPVMPVFHPGYLLRTPSAKAKAWHDFLAIRRKYASEVAP